MSVIVVSKEKNEILIASDAYVGDGSSKYTHRAKFFTKNNITIGAVGSSRVADVIEKNLIIPYFKGDSLTYVLKKLIPNMLTTLDKNRALYNDDKGLYFTDSEFVVLCDEEIIYVSDELSVNKIDGNFFAIGGGAQYALGALEVLRNSQLKHREKIIKAINISEKYLSIIEKPYYIMNIKSKKIEKYD